MIDWERVDCLREEIGEADFGEVVRLFIEEVEEVVDRLERPGTPEQREADLHFMKGSALNLGFRELAALCQTLEKQAAAGAKVDTMPLIAAYKSSLRAFLDGLGADLSGEAA